MIKMVKVKDIQPGMIVSTDGMKVQESYSLPITGLIYIGGVCQGIPKWDYFKRNDELPIYYDDSNDGED